MWAHTLCKERQNVRIQSIGLGKLSRRLGEVADLTWIRHHQRESRGGERTVMRRRRAISSPLRHWPDVS